MYIGMVPPAVPEATEARRTAQKSKVQAKHKEKHPKSNRKTSNYEQKSVKKYKSYKKASSKSKVKKHPAKASHSHIDATADTYVEKAAVPNPHPDAGNYAATTVTPSISVFTYQSIHTGILPVIPTTTHSPAPTSGFSPLPPLAAAATSLALTSSVVSPSSSQSLPTTSSVSGHASQSHNGPRHLPTVIIVLLTIGLAFLLLGAYIVFRLCTRPRKHIPTPSLPILQDPFSDEKEVDPEEESLFGGKERTSARPGSNTMPLPWTQYPHSSIAKPPPALEGSHSPPKRTSREIAQKGTFGLSSPNTTANGNLAPRTPNRLSMMSMSVYPGSPMSAMGNGPVGVAITASPLTADGTAVLQRSNTKPAARRMSRSNKNTRQSMVISDRLFVPGTGDSDPYSSADVHVPAVPKTAAQTSAGRARVKAPYAPESLLRVSSTLSGPGAKSGQALMDEQNPFEDTQYILPPIMPTMKSDDRRERETKALTNALGLVTPDPCPPSPTTVYPDDSITLAGDRRRSRSFGHSARPLSTMMSPQTEAAARLGKLMLDDSQSMVSLPSTKNVNAGAGNSSGRRPVTRKRVEELPPRVPSPPPLPSLAQMALAHTNPMDFEDYRSPTYSIYGLYEADRKSRN